MRAIDADELRKGLKEKYMLQRNSVILAMIDDAPTIDPVKRAKWAFPEGGITGCVVCSNCQVFPISKNGRWVLSKYCPDCGAKMEE